MIQTNSKPYTTTDNVVTSFNYSYERFNYRKFLKAHTEISIASIIIQTTLSNLFDCFSTGLKMSYICLL